MSSILGNILRVSPVVFAASLLISQTTVAAEATRPQTGNADKNESPDILEQLDRYSQVNQESDPLERINSVNQLSDVRPTDWAYSALRGLAERYGCLLGYRDGTYRGNPAMTRYEFAASLDECMNVIQRLIEEATSDIGSQDLEQLGRLQEEFAAELATLRARVDGLEVRTAELEANQFSTTTKLTGEAIFAVTDAFGSSDDNQTAFQQRVRLNFNASLTGQDLLIARLQVGNGAPLALESTNNGVQFFTSTSEGFQAHQVFGDTENSVTLDTLQYQFPLGEKARMFVAANAGIWDDFAPTLNPFFEDFDGGSGSLSAFAQRNPIYRLGGGAGLGLSVKPNQNLELTLGYLAAEASSPTPGAGLFNGDFSALAQVTWTPSDTVGAGLTYNRAYFGAGRFGFDNGGGHLDSGTLPFTGTSLANRVGATSATNTDSLGFQFALEVSPKLQVNGWVGYTKVNLRDRDIDGSIWNGALLLGFPDLGKEGNLGGLVVGVEPYLTGLDGFDDEFEQDAPIRVEGFYKLQMTEGIAITPGFIWLLSPNQDSDNDDIFVGTLRTTFTF